MHHGGISFFEVGPSFPDKIILKNKTNFRSKNMPDALICPAKLIRFSLRGQVFLIRGVITAYNPRPWVTLTLSPCSQGRAPPIAAHGNTCNESREDTRGPRVCGKGIWDFGFQSRLLIISHLRRLMLKGSEYCAKRLRTLINRSIKLHN